MKLARQLVSFAVVPLVLTLAACGSSDDGGSPQPVAGKSSATAAASTAPTAKTAAQIVGALAKPKGAKVTVWTEETDPNSKLGRPGGYTSSATVADPRAECGTPVDTSCGLTVEVWPTEAEAADRAKYISTVLKSSGLGTEYHTVRGPALLRVTGQLTPKAAKVYAESFGKATP